MKTQTAQLDTEIVKQLNELQSNATSLVNTFGQIYIRRKILNEEYENLQKLEKESDASYVETNTEINKILENLKSEYPNGSIDLQTGTVTYVVDEEN